MTVGPLMDWAGDSPFCSDIVAFCVMPQYILDAGVLSPLAAQPQYDRFAIHPAQS